ncbi:DNA-deoxyinosine glycosylase [Neptunomonas antarctica]|uniref:G/U mismatch-specific uracil-DNA glycosylase n=1 Tax=Neptunomonas antarctica TaxID=619304 RepID=A0A1N7NWL0_9GAMM|nr:DNA-deoxyinosine glycosylase [Neptunomonas antarctica]SIT02688.1 G/U mismatch-specific uracil-DNA glycosylase [Neptunomonas antarctica]
MNTPIISFNYVASASATILILGSMPGVKSLQEQQYYAHPRNTFWRIMGEFFDFEPRELESGLNYTSYLALLQEHGIALWDVAHQCIRPGSLDSEIDRKSVVPNAIPALLTTCPHIHTICFNGQTAAKMFKQHFPDLLNNPNLRFITLPSTSPAHAALTFTDKLNAWNIVKNSRPY